MKNSIFYLLALISFLTISFNCKSDDPHSDMMKDNDHQMNNTQMNNSMPDSHMTNSQMNGIKHTTSEGTEELDRKLHSGHMIEGYMGIKNALVKDDLSTLKTETNDMIEHAGFIKKDDLDNENKKMVSSIQEDLQKIKSASTVDEARRSFRSLTEIMYKFIKERKELDGTVYYQYCPMAFNDEGAYWLSMDKEVSNPYFGKKMMKCGETKEEIKAGR